MKLIKILLVIIVFSCSNALSAQYISVDDTYTAQRLIQNVLLNNSNCATATNISVSGDTFSSGEQSYGYFSYSGTNFPFANGIVLSTSRASRTAGPNSDLIDEGSTAWQGDADLEQALGLPGNTFNATFLEFDFTPQTSKISFDYIFASEEYQGSAPCRYSDGFAFLLKELGTSNPYTNLAVIPGTTTPVKVTSVHPEISGTTSCAAENPEYFAGYNGTNQPINFNGETVKMTAKADVIPGKTYHIKLVIADEENIRYDSAIFLGGGSFNVGADLGENRLIATNNPLCQGEKIILNATEPGTNQYQWFKNGIALPGEINPLYSVIDSGIYKVEINIGSTTCVATGEVTIEYVPLPTLTTPVTLAQCDDNTDGISTFDLTKVDDIIKQGNTQLSSVVYYISLNDAKNQLNPIQSPASFQNTTINQVFARVTNSFGCANYATVNLKIANNSLPTINPFYFCDKDGTLDGITAIDLNSQITPTVLNGLPSGLVVSYYLTDINITTTVTNPLLNNFTNSTANHQIIYAIINNGPDCYGVIPINLNIVAFNPPNFQHEDVPLCPNDSVDLSVALGFSSYTWNTGNRSSKISVSTANDYSVTVTNPYGCQATKTFTVFESGPPTIASIDINDFSQNNNTVQINVTGNGIYEYSLNGAIFQSSPLFSNVAIGQYTVTVQDIYGCGIARQLINVLDYPKYFTPNGDGYNDIWYIKNLDAAATITIFDRYGKFIYSFNGNQQGWDGKYNMKELFSSDYWFVINLANGKIIRGHFALKR